MAPQVGQVVNSKYRLLRHIGDGGMGSVFEARHEALGTTVALKFLHLEFSRREGLVQRFLQEARASAQIQSAHVVRVADVDQTADGDVFIVLEYLEGKTLQALYEELYRGGGRLSYQEALDFAVQILEGVEAAHRAGIVHRDLKPDNVMITVDSKGASLLKLLDFGIAKLKAIGGAPGLTRPGVMMGTPEYMAPEQAWSADSVDVRADVFSLGVMIFELLAGQRPVGGEEPHALAAAYRSGNIARLGDLVPNMPADLVAAVHRAMAGDPQDRFPTVTAMREAIEPHALAARAPLASGLRASMSEVGRPSRVGPAPARPGAAGVAKTWPPDSGEEAAAAPRNSGTVVDTPAPARIAGTAPGGGGGQTHRIDQPYGYPPVGGLVAPAPMYDGGASARSPRRRRRGSGATVVWSLVGAAAIAGLVTGAVYLSSHSSSKDDDSPAPSASAPPVGSVAPQVPTTQTDPPPYVPVPTPTQAPTHKQPAGPRPKPSATPSASPSAPPSPSPSPPPVLILPSAFPFPNPFAPAPAPAQPAPGPSKPQQPAPQDPN